MMEVKRFRIDDLPSAAVASWDQLLRTSDLQSPFLSHAFCQAVGEVRGDVYVLQLKSENGEEGFLPFQYKNGRRFLRQAEKVGGHMSDYFGIIGNIREISDTSELLRRGAISALRLDHAVPHKCPFELADVELSFGSRIRTQSYSEFVDRLNRTNKVFLKEVARAERRLRADHGECKFEWDAGDSLGALRHIVNEKRAQYARTAMPDCFAELWSRKLLERLLQNTDQALCKPVLSTLHCQDGWIASNLGLICGKTMHIWFPAYDLRFKRYGPGHILFFKMIEHGCQEGIDCFDFGEGLSPYKAEYRGENYELFKGRISAGGLLAKLERIVQSAEWRVNQINGKLGWFTGQKVS